MSQRTFNLIAIITSSLAAIAVGVVQYIGKGPVQAIVDSIPLIEGCIIGVCANFTIKAVSELTKKTTSTKKKA